MHIRVDLLKDSNIDVYQEELRNQRITHLLQSNNKSQRPWTMFELVLDLLGVDKVEVQLALDRG